MKIYTRASNRTAHALMSSQNIYRISLNKRSTETTANNYLYIFKLAAGLRRCLWIHPSYYIITFSIITLLHSLIKVYQIPVTIRIYFIYIPILFPHYSCFYLTIRSLSLFYFLVVLSELPLQASEPEGILTYGIYFRKDTLIKHFGFFYQFQISEFSFCIFPCWQFREWIRKTMYNVFNFKNYFLTCLWS